MEYDPPTSSTWATGTSSAGFLPSSSSTPAVSRPRTTFPHLTLLWLLLFLLLLLLLLQLLPFSRYGACPDPAQPEACPDQPDRVSVLNVATKSGGGLDSILGSAYIPDPALPGELLVEFPGSKCVGPLFSSTLVTSSTSHLPRPGGILLGAGHRLPLLLRGLLLHRLPLRSHQARVRLDPLQGQEPRPRHGQSSTCLFLPTSSSPLFFLFSPSSPLAYLLHSTSIKFTLIFQLEYCTDVLVANGIDISPIEDTVQDDTCVYDRP